MGRAKRQKMVAFTDIDLHKQINVIAKELETTAQEVVRKGVEAYLEKLSESQAEFYKRVARR